MNALSGKKNQKSGQQHQLGKKSVIEELSIQDLMAADCTAYS